MCSDKKLNMWKLFRVRTSIVVFNASMAKINNAGKNVSHILCTLAIRPQSTSHVRQDTQTISSSE